MSPSQRTIATELATGLGITGIYGDIEDALENGPPDTLLNVEEDKWRSLTESVHKWQSIMVQAFCNGRYFLQAEDGLGGVLPHRVEWKGPQPRIGDESVPADLRVNWVYLVSCKYNSKVLHNSSPPHVFERLLSTERKRKDNWFLTIAPSEFQSLYAAVKSEIGSSGNRLPDQVQDLNKAQQKELKKILGTGWPGSTKERYIAFSKLVSQKSAAKWKRNLKGQNLKALMVHRLIRLCPCPYFILGLKNNDQPVRLRVDSPWDWNQRFKLLDFQVSSPSDMGQPRVDWAFIYQDKCLHEAREVKGHIEVRWSHGRFKGPPEAKVYLDTDPRQVPGYNSLERIGVPRADPPMMD